MTHTLWTYEFHKEPLGGGGYTEVYTFGPEDECEVGRVEVRDDYEDPCEARADAETHVRFIAAAPETAAERDKLKAINAALIAALEYVEAYCSKPDRAFLRAWCNSAIAKAQPAAPK